MKKRRYKPSKISMTAIGFVILFFIVILVINAIEKSIEPKVRDICEYYCKSELSQISVGSAYEVIEQYEIDYEDIAVKLIENGEISAVEIRTENVNKIQSAITDKILNNFENNKNSTISIPLGNVCDFLLLSGKGPEIEVQFLPEISVNTRIINDFVSAGINQTKHTFSLEIVIEAIAVLPAENIKLNVSTECILAECILIGDVPQGIIGNYIK